jgi:hypothetical protein
MVTKEAADLESLSVLRKQILLCSTDRPLAAQPTVSSYSLSSIATAMTFHVVYINLIIFFLSQAKN